jgi:hypothetical protein
MLNYLNTNIGYDATFELNEFNEPRIRSEIEVVKDVILFILFSKPGQYPSLPHIGLDIQSILYSFYDELDEVDLKHKINEQCNAMGVYMNNGAIQIKKTKYKGHPSLMISIDGTEQYPEGYMKDHINNSNRYLIGITFNELNQMIYNINSEGGV